MPQSLAQVYLHLVFSTKDRREYLVDEAVRKELWAYMAGTLKNFDCPALIIGGATDHVHVLCRLSREMKISEMVRDLKRASSKWFKEKGEAGFSWQAGYGVFSVSASNVERVLQYIRDQETHHHKMSFQDELRTILQKHGVEFNERYLWD